MTYSTLIVDDEALAREELRYLLREFEEIEIVGEAADGHAALALVEERDPDLLFLDIQMPEMDGFAVLKALMGRERLPHVIFATAYDQYALDAFEANAVDYLLKPIDHEKLARAVRRLVTRIRAGGKPDERFAKLLANLNVSSRVLNRVPALEGDGIRLLDVEEIASIEREGRRVLIRTEERSWETNYPDLKELEASLPADEFLRIDENHLVNVRHIKEIVPWSGGNHRLVLDDRAGTRIQLNRAQARRLRSHLEGLQGRA